MTKQFVTLSSVLLAGTALAGTPTMAPAPAPAPAPPASVLNYNGLQAGWLHTEWDSPYLDSSDGVGGSVSFSPFEHLYLVGGGAWQDVNVVGESTDMWLANVGAGGFFSLSSNVDFVVEGGASFYGFSNSPIGADNDASAYARPHFRGRWANLEVHAGAAWTNLDITNEWAGFGRVFYGLTDTLDLSAGISAGKNEYTVNVGLRLRY